MTQPGDRERDLVDFLRQNRPEVPQAASDLEEVIFEQINTISTSNSNSTSTAKFLSFKLSKILRSFGSSVTFKSFARLVPSLMTAALAMLVILNHLNSTEFTDVEVAELETFIEENWHGSLGKKDESELFF